MKKRFLFIALIGMSFGTKAQITELSNGNIGIGVTNPDKNLTVKNQIKIIKSGNSRTQGDKAELIFGEGSNDYYSGSIKVVNTNSNPSNVNPKMVFSLQDSNTHQISHLKERMVIQPDGNVGIGTTSPDSKLSVNGKIHAKEVKVDLVGWSDFVFYDNYNLPTLEEVENHIKEKGHLKDIPSAKEVLKNGIYLGEMDSKLLRKIEELTLYTIAQEKQIKKQSEKIQNLESLNRKFIELQKRLEKLEKK